MTVKKLILCQLEQASFRMHVSVKTNTSSGGSQKWSGEKKALSVLLGELFFKRRNVHRFKIISRKFTTVFPIKVEKS